MQNGKCIIVVLLEKSDVGSAAMLPFFVSVFFSSLILGSKLNLFI